MLDLKMLKSQRDGVMMMKNEDEDVVNVFRMVYCVTIL